MHDTMGKPRHTTASAAHGLVPSAADSTAVPESLACTGRPLPRHHRHSLEVPVTHLERAAARWGELFRTRSALAGKTAREVQAIGHRLVCRLA